MVRLLKYAGTLTLIVSMTAPISAYAASTGQAVTQAVVATGVGIGGAMLVSALIQSPYSKWPVTPTNPDCLFRSVVVTPPGNSEPRNPNPKGKDKCFNFCFYVDPVTGPQACVNPNSGGSVLSKFGGIGGGAAASPLSSFVNGLAQGIGSGLGSALIGKLFQGGSGSGSSGGVAGQNCTLMFTSSTIAVVPTGCGCPDPATIPAGVTVSGCMSTVSQQLLAQPIAPYDSATTTASIQIDPGLGTIPATQSTDAITTVRAEAEGQGPVIGSATGKTGSATLAPTMLPSAAKPAPSLMEKLRLSDVAQQTYALEEQDTSNPTQSAPSSLESSVPVVETSPKKDSVMGFSGSAATQQSSSGIINTTCSSRPWQSGLMSRFFAPAFFDSLCERYGFVQRSTAPAAAFDTTTAERKVRAPASVRDDSLIVTRPDKGISCIPGVVTTEKPITLSWSCGASSVVQTKGFTATTGGAKSITPSSNATYGIVCADGFESSCAVRVIRPTAQIAARPALVRLGTRTTIYWRGVDMQSCSVSGPGVQASGLEGAVMTPPVNEVTTYSLVCARLDGATSTAHVSVDIGG